MAKAFSIRAPLQGELMDFLNGSGIACAHTAELVRDITCLLASYREEDVPLFPDVFVLTDLATLSSMSPGTERVTIKAGIALNVAAERMLKDCASLAVRGWSVYVAKTAENLAEYGLFRSAMHSFATTAEEMMVEQGEVPIVLVRNRGRLVLSYATPKMKRLPHRSLPHRQQNRLLGNRCLSTQQHQLSTNRKRKVPPVLVLIVERSVAALSRDALDGALSSRKESSTGATEQWRLAGTVGRLVQCLCVGSRCE